MPRLSKSSLSAQGLAMFSLSFAALVLTCPGAFATEKLSEKLGESYRAIGTGPTCEDAKTQARHAARVWRKIHCPDNHITKHASDDGFEPADPKAYRTPDERVKCTKLNSEVYVYRDVTCVVPDVKTEKSAIKTKKTAS